MEFSRKKLKFLLKKKNLVLLLVIFIILISVATPFVILQWMEKKETKIEKKKVEPIIENRSNEIEIDIKEKILLSEEEFDFLELKRNPFSPSYIVLDKYKEKEEEYQQKLDELKRKLEEEKRIEEEQKRREQEGDSGTEPNEDEEEISIDPRSVEALVTKKSRVYQIDEKWIYAIIGAYNNEEIEVNLMKLTEESAEWLSYEMGLTYETGMYLEREMNIEMGTYYLRHIINRNDDLHYMFTAYKYGQNGAEQILEQSGSYETEYSREKIEFVDQN